MTGGPKRTLALWLALLLSLAGVRAAHAKEKVIVRGLPENPTFIGKTKCVAPFLCLQDGEARVATYDPHRWGNPKFHPGEVVLRNGAVLKGTVALLTRQQDWDFVKHIALLIPEGEREAFYVGAGDAAVIRQQEDDATVVYDLYGDVYLARLVSGPIRLSYNPSAGTSRKMLDFLPPALLDDLANRAAAEAALAALKDGKSLRESVEAGDGFSGALGEALGSIEITEKEYLLYDEATRETELVTRANYRSAIEALFASCPSADAGKVRSFAGDFDEIREAVTYRNSTCP